MQDARALPIQSPAGCNVPMLSGQELAAALRLAMHEKHVGPTEVARAFEVRQPSVSGWMKDGRIAKKHIPHLLSYFADVVGPDHWGLPFTRQEFEAVLLFRQLPPEARQNLIDRMKSVVHAANDLGSWVDSPARVIEPSKRLANGS